MTPPARSARPGAGPSSSRGPGSGSSPGGSPSHGSAPGCSHGPSHGRVAGVILAAGASVRLGQPKQLLRYRGETLIGRAARLARAAGLAPIHVVVGYRGGEVAAAVGEPGDSAAAAVTVVANPDWRRGMGSSLARGIASLPATAEAALVLVTDQPHLSAALLGAILTTYRAGEASLVACRYAGGTVGVPALFARRHFRELTGLSGDRGARALFARHADTLATVSFPAGDTDVDTPAAAATLDPKQGPRLRGSPHV